MKAKLLFSMLVVVLVTALPSSAEEVECKFCDNDSKCQKAVSWIQYSLSWTDCAEGTKCSVGGLFCWKTCKGLTSCYTGIDNTACVELIDLTTPPPPAEENDEKGEIAT